VETKRLTPEAPLPQPFSTPVARTSKEPTVTQIVYDVAAYCFVILNIIFLFE
jgi:hypothetical protein